MNNQKINSNKLIFERAPSYAVGSNLELVYMWDPSNHKETPINDPLLGALEDLSVAQYLQQLTWMPQHMTDLFVPNQLATSLI
ncbi:MAG: hypothetical protein EXR35_07295 [Limnohabitans sp.]|nr:hypothetical protein [Limnohabitans sp.]